MRRMLLPIVAEIMNAGLRKDAGVRRMLGLADPVLEATRAAHDGGLVPEGDDGLSRRQEPSA
jgi:hypothetical protein